MRHAAYGHPALMRKNRWLRTGALTAPERLVPSMEMRVDETHAVEWNVCKPGVGKPPHHPNLAKFYTLLPAQGNMIRRNTEKIADNDKTTDHAKTVLYGLVIATALTWVAPALLGVDLSGDISTGCTASTLTDSASTKVELNADCTVTTTTKGTGAGNADVSTTGSPCDGGASNNIVACLAYSNVQFKLAVNQILDVVKMVLLVAAVGALAVLRVKIPHTHVA